jgi:hypothetical protein
VLDLPHQGCGDVLARQYARVVRPLVYVVPLGPRTMDEPVRSCQRRHGNGEFDLGEAADCGQSEGQRNLSRVPHRGREEHVSALEPPAAVEGSPVNDGFRDAAMHGSVGLMQRLASEADVHEAELDSGRTALHKAAFWGHIKAVEFLVTQLKLDGNQQDMLGDTPLHDAARFGHEQVVQTLLAAGPDLKIRNTAGLTAHALAIEYGKTAVAEIIQAAS